MSKGRRDASVGSSKMALRLRKPFFLLNISVIKYVYVNPLEIYLLDYGRGEWNALGENYRQIPTKKAPLAWW